VRADGEPIETIELVAARDVARITVGSVFKELLDRLLLK
jgi:hypothetical protein